MATERLLIDANALKKYMCFKCNDEYSDEPCEPSDCVFYNAIKNATTVDAVEVVRCKDCKHYMLWEDSEDKKTCAKSIGLMVSDPDDFCSYGERRTDNE